jgi:hypothetical protein
MGNPMYKARVKSEASTGMSVEVPTNADLNNADLVTDLCIVAIPSDL